MCDMFFGAHSNSMFDKEFKAGNYTLPFEFKLPLNTPSSYEQHFSKKEKAMVTYFLQAELFLDE